MLLDYALPRGGVQGSWNRVTLREEEFDKGVEIEEGFRLVPLSSSLLCIPGQFVGGSQILVSCSIRRTQIGRVDNLSGAVMQDSSDSETPDGRHRF